MKKIYWLLNLPRTFIIYLLIKRCRFKFNIFKDLERFAYGGRRYEGYDAIYLATEERKIRDAFEKAFPDKILENKRVYYDDIYDLDDSISYRKHNDLWK